MSATGVESILKLSVEQVLGEDGLLAQQIEHFQARSQQLDMARQIQELVGQNQVLIAEAGTGTGKTFAYLVPALISEQKTIVSTGTKTLQDQLFNKDIPDLIKRLNLKSKVRLLKGRSNYLCLHRYHQTRFTPLARFPENKDLFAHLKTWEHHTDHGEVAEFIEHVENPMMLSNITSTPENCLGTECDHHTECFVYKARRRALEADVLVINHHLLFADMAIKQDGFGELLPQAEMIILDESHQIAEIASRFFSQLFSSRQCKELLSDLLTESGELDGAFAVISDPHEQLKRALRDTILAMSQMPQRESSVRLFKTPMIIESFELLAHHMNVLEAALAPLAEQSAGLQALHERLLALGDCLQDMQTQPDAHFVYWFETRDNYFALHKSPLDVADPLTAFRATMESSWVLTSATITVDHSFEHFQKQTGFADAQTLMLDSPFDYPNQALMLLPKELPEPNDSAFNDAMFAHCLPIIEACEGGVFFLFTSHRSLRMAARYFEQHSDRELFIQGSQNRHQMLEGFRQSDHGLLLGAASFWEGVDVSGSHLSLVIIDKLPFANPSDPVLKAQIEHINKHGGNAFFDHQIPKAIISLKQGAGRLIRGEQDRGVLVLCDRRLISKGYGSTFLKSIPPMTVTHDREDAIRFLQDIAAK